GGDRRARHSFPTRRSSDLRVWAAEADVASASLDLQYAVEDSDRTTAQARLEDALGRLSSAQGDLSDARSALTAAISHRDGAAERSEEHTSELQSRENLVCR